MQDWLTYKSEAQNFVKRVKDYLLCIEVTEERVANDAAGKRGDDTGEPSWKGIGPSKAPASFLPDCQDAENKVTEVKPRGVVLGQVLELLYVIGHLACRRDQTRLWQSHTQKIRLLSPRTIYTLRRQIKRSWRKSEKPWRIWCMISATCCLNQDFLAVCKQTWIVTKPFISRYAG